MNYMKNTVHFLLDGSTSMVDRWNETIQSINTYVKELKSSTLQEESVSLYTEREEIYLTVDMFQYIDRFKMVPLTNRQVNIRNFKYLDPHELKPCGMTPLNDGIVNICSRIWEISPKKAILVVVTDGYENVSRASYLDAQSSLNRLKLSGHEVVFLGADFDNSQQAQSYNIDLSKSQRMVHDSYDVTLSDLSRQTVSYMRGTSEVNLKKDQS